MKQAPQDLTTLPPPPDLHSNVQMGYIYDVVLSD